MYLQGKLYGRVIITNVTRQQSSFSYFFTQYYAEDDDQHYNEDGMEVNGWSGNYQVVKTHQPLTFTKMMVGGETDTSIASSIPRLKNKDQKRWNSSGVATFSLEIKMGKITRETFCIPPYLLDRWKRERVNLCGAQGLETLILAAKSN